jgi:hypothetical protein
MVQPVRGGIPQLGCFFRGASQVVQPRTLRGIGRFLLGLLFAAFDRTVAGICDAVADAPTAAALREFLRSKALTPKLARLLDWKTRQLIRKAFRSPRNRRGPIILAMDSTIKGALPRLARHLFFVGKGDRVGNHIFAWGLLVLPNGRRLPLCPRLKRTGRRSATQVDLAARSVREVAADNVAAIERGALTPHGRKKLHEHLRGQQPPSAQKSRSAKKPRPKARKAA